MCLILLSFLIIQKVIAQDSTWQQKPNVNISGYIDVFYAYDFNKPATSFRQPFFFQYNRHNEFDLNLGYVQFEVSQTKYRANVALQAGTYANDNYANEPGVLKNISQANIGLSLNKMNNLWIDAGIISSHIGFETVTSIDNWNLSRSIPAELSPYYLTGAKLTYNPNKKLELGGLICNGWQHIRKVQGNSLLSYGTQVKYTASENLLLNWSTFIGTDDPDSTRRMRFFNNFYGQFFNEKRLNFIAGFDMGFQQHSKGSNTYDHWLSPILIARYKLTTKFYAGARAEYYQDKTGIIIYTGTPNGFTISGCSLNLDYKPVSNIACRIEGRWLNSVDKIFVIDNHAKATDFFMVASVSIRFNK